MNELPQLLKYSSNLESINLEFCEIESLDPLLPYLIQFVQLKELLLFGNRLETIPKDLSKLKTLEKLDISNNLIDSIESIIPGLSSLPKLQELHITLQTSDDEQNLLQNLPNLLNLNGNFLENYKKNSEFDLKNSYDTSDDKDFEKTLLACESSGFFGEEVLLSQEFLEKIASLYDDIRSMWIKEDKSKDEQHATEFDEGLKSIMNELSEVLKDGHQDFIISVFSMKAKYELALICQKKITDLVSKKNEKLGSKLEEVQEILVNVFKDIIKKFIQIQPRLQKKIKNMKNEIEIAQHESAEVLEAADQLRKESELHQQEKHVLINHFNTERNEMLAEIESLQEENKKYLDMIIRHSKTYAESALSARSQEILEDEKRCSISISTTKQGKVLSLRQLKESIEEIYNSKIKYDERCVESKMPRETLEQHMYNYLNKKYGLKNLVIDWASSIVSSVKKYSNEDNDVNVFGMILRNECDEEFRFVQFQVKKTVAELLRMNLKNKFPLKSNADIIDITNEKINGYVTEDEWVEVVRFMYNQLDSEIIVGQLYDLIRAKDYPSDIIVPKGKITREEALIYKEKEKYIKNRILYTDLLQFLLNFQLKAHQKYLKKLLNVFKKVDSNSDGVLNEKEFQRLIAGIGIGFSTEDFNRLLQVIDPFDNQQITFSEVVNLFSTELVPPENVPILQKISMDGQ